MSADSIVSPATLFWRDGSLVFAADGKRGEFAITAADSWLVSDGRVRALAAHRDRFIGSTHNAEEFWDATVEALPGTGDWFPRVEQRADMSLSLELRVPPERSRSAILATWEGPDPRSQPLVKGPDLAAMQEVRDSVAPLGATEAVILDQAGCIVEGAYSALLWWRGDILCGPVAEAERIPSVTAGSALALAAALGLDTWEESITPDELEGTELWVLSALHGIRIATAWVDGPELAERPGRLQTWRSRFDALRRAV